MGARKQLHIDINNNMDENAMSYEELIIRLKSMKAQIEHHKQLTKELHLLDAQYWYICSQDRKGLLPNLGFAKSKEIT